MGGYCLGSMCVPELLDGTVGFLRSLVLVFLVFVKWNSVIKGLNLQ